MSEPSKVNAQINTALGSAKEMLGSTIEAGYQAVGGSSEPSSFTTAGKEQRLKGEGEMKAAEAKGYAEGRKDAVVGAITGDKAQEAKGNVQHDKGEAQMKLNS
ncbi:uncharacterized protein LOC62_07G009220 [Vanrija pseudolonga]|uniref:CsbD-like domain-containing protein n=1 Tax=Vanrija pseudolonga TaxID=143232 RepID=A0AAF0YFI9_9TREE|nr:hypothetical protein LOC62_07G009220 [Vanrija pseudolonga]